jgi:hypothetical protein
MLSFFSPGTPQLKKRKYREDLLTVHKIKPKIITSYSRFICSIDSSDMMQYTLGWKVGSVLLEEGSFQH